jgi:sulfide dehydrogenase [flavocytochrome c] flavoprotein subunit
MAGEQPDQEPVFSNTCYSYVNGDSAMHVANVYRFDDVKKAMIKQKGGGLSKAPNQQEAEYARAWARNIWADTLT